MSLLYHAIEGRPPSGWQSPKGSTSSDLVLFYATIAVISLKSSWVMTCAFEKSQSSMIASGGLDNVCSIHEVGGDKPSVELQGHDGYLSCCHFVDKASILTASGDSTCIFWDINRAEEVQHFTDHGGDVMSLSVHPTDRNIFVSGSCDTTAKVRTFMRACATSSCWSQRSSSTLGQHRVV